jgi:hypothetical protein
VLDNSTLSGSSNDTTGQGIVSSYQIWSLESDTKIYETFIHINPNVSVAALGRSRGCW